MTSRAGIGALALILVTSWPGSAVAQQRGARDFARWLQQNRAQLAQYGWTVRTEILIDGETASVKTERVSYSPGGAPERTPVQAESGTGRRSRKRLARVEEKVEALRRLIDDYQHMKPQDIGDAFARAFVDEVEGSRDAEIRVQVFDVAYRGDSMSLWLDRDLLPVRLEILTALDGEPVSVRGEYDRVDGGPCFVARSVIETETGERKLLIRTEVLELENVRE